MTKKTIIVAAVLLLAAVLFVGAGAAAEHHVQTGADLAKLIAGANATVGSGDTIILDNDIVCNGMSVKGGKNFVLDFNGHTLTFNKPGAGSTNTETNGFQLLKDSTITFKNGIITIAKGNEVHITQTTEGKPIRMLIQNYADLTLENVVLDATYINHQFKITNDEVPRYALSINQGPVNITGTTSIKTPRSTDFAFDVCKNGNYTAPVVTVNTTGTITGNIEYSLTTDTDGKLDIKNVNLIGDIKAGTTLPAVNKNLIISGGTFTVTSPESKALIQKYAPTIVPTIGQSQQTLLTLAVPESYVLVIPASFNFVKSTESGISYEAVVEMVGVDQIKVESTHEVQVKVKSGSDPAWKLTGNIAYKGFYGESTAAMVDNAVFLNSGSESSVLKTMKFTIANTETVGAGTHTDTLTFSASIQPITA